MNQFKADKNITGYVFGKLTVLERTQIKTKSGVYKWRCKCICGKETLTARNHLIRGLSTSCGCNRQSKNPEQSFFKDMFQTYKYHAEKRNLVFELNYIDFIQLSKQKCFYCGQEPELRFRRRGIKANGIDRVDSSKGYIKNNVVACYGTHNIMKNDMSFNEFKENILKLYNHLFKEEKRD